MIKKVFHNIIIILVLGQILALPKLALFYDVLPKNNSLSLSQKIPSKDFGKVISEISIFEEVEEDTHDGNNDNLLLYFYPEFHFSFLTKSNFDNCFSLNYLNLGKLGSKLFILHRNLRI